MRKILLGALVALVLVLAAGSALAAKPAHAGPPAPSGTISGPNEAGPYAFGDSVTFTTTSSNLKGNQYPLVYVECRSVVDGSLLYGQLDLPETVFVLGGGSSPWWDQRDDVNCLAHLYAYGGKAIVELAAPVAFAAAGS